MSKTYFLKRQQLLQVPIDQAWSFFSDPSNLAAITPEALSFKVISSEQGASIYPGQLIEYTIKPLLGIPWYWMTEITHVKDLELFVDEQRFGPYSFWHHQHHFEAQGQQTLMTDLVHYRLPGWFLGDWMHSLFVRKQLEGIFAYRYKVVGERFNLENVSNVSNV